MNVISICYSPMCGHRVIGQARVCPRCGGRMHSPRTVRTLGVVMMACGLFITALMGVITWQLAPTLAQAGNEAASVRFTGDAEQARMILQLFWLTISFGVAAAAAGAWQVVTARRSRLVTAGVLVLAGLLYVTARATEWSLA